MVWIRYGRVWTGVNLLRRTLCAVTALVLLCTFLRISLVAEALRRNCVYVAYNRLLLGHHVDSGALDYVIHGLEAHSRLQQRDWCLFGNLYALRGDPPKAREYWESAPQPCNRVVVVDDQQASLPLASLISNRKVYPQGSGQVEFRKNSSIFGPVYLMRSGFYRVGLRAQCVGPEPARIRLDIDDAVQVFEFCTITGDRFWNVDLEKGLHWFAISFTNDVYEQYGDRNARVKEVWIELRIAR